MILDDIILQASNHPEVVKIFTTDITIWVASEYIGSIISKKKTFIMESFEDTDGTPRVLIVHLPRTLQTEIGSAWRTAASGVPPQKPIYKNVCTNEKKHSFNQTSVLHHTTKAHDILSHRSPNFIQALEE